MRVDAAHSPHVTKMCNDLFRDGNLLAVDHNLTEVARPVIDDLNDARSLILFRQSEQHSPLNQVTIVRIPNVTHANRLNGRSIVAWRKRAIAERDHAKLFV